MKNVKSNGSQDWKRRQDSYLVTLVLDSLINFCVESARLNQVLMFCSCMPKETVDKLNSGLSTTSQSTHVRPNQCCLYEDYQFIPFCQIGAETSAMVMAM